MKKQLFSCLIIMLTCVTGFSQISGVAFLDVNGDGIRQTTAPLEPFASVITVNIYNSTGALAGTANTSATGAYSIAPSGQAPFRVEFIIPVNSVYTPAAGSSAYGSSI